MLKKIYTLLLVFLLLSIFFSPLSSSDEPASEPLKAYRAAHIPTIDGIKSIGEWDDTEAYFSETTVPPDMTLTTDKAIMSLYLKHDSKNLYILFTINDDDYDKAPSSWPDFLTIFWESNYTMGLMVSSNGSIYHARSTMSGMSPGGPMIAEDVAKAAVSYNNGNYTFEISININHFFEPVYKNQIQFGIVFEDANYTGSGGILGKIHSVGFSNSANTISLLPEPYYSRYFPSSGIWILGVVIIVVLIGLMLKIRKVIKIRK